MKPARKAFPMKNPTELNFTPIGAYGIEAAVTEENVFLKLSSLA